MLQVGSVPEQQYIPSSFAAQARGSAFQYARASQLAGVSFAKLMMFAALLHFILFGIADD